MKSKMTEEEKKENQEVQEKPKDTQSKEKQPETKEEPEIDFEALRKEIEDADKTLVSEDVQKLLKEEKEAARKEAEKEFLVNQRLKEKEAEIENLKNASVEEQKKAAEQLAYLKAKLDELVTTKQVVNNENPFKKKEEAEPTQNEMIAKLTDDDIDAIEYGSLQAILERQRE
jgi:hypothetical protein